MTGMKFLNGLCLLLAAGIMAYMLEWKESLKSPYEKEAEALKKEEAALSLMSGYRECLNSSPTLLLDVPRSAEWISQASRQLWAGDEELRKAVDGYRAFIERRRRFVETCQREKERNNWNREEIHRAAQVYKQQMKTTAN